MKAHLRSLSIGLAAINLAGACVPPASRPLASPALAVIESSATGSPGEAARGPASPLSTPPSEPPASTRPVDTTLAPISRSDPGPEAQAVLDLCGLDPDRISGMAKIPKARHLPRYVRLTGKEPEIQVDEPAWVVTYSGRFTIRTVWVENPTCVVIEGEPLLFMTGDYGRGDTVSHPLTSTDPPLALPTLAP